MNVRRNHAICIIITEMHIDSQQIRLFPTFSKHAPSFVRLELLSRYTTYLTIVQYFSSLHLFNSAQSVVEMSIAETKKIDLCFYILRLCNTHHNQPIDLPWCIL